MKKIVSIKTLTLSIITCAILTGCSSKDDFATPQEPSKEIVTVLNVEPISKDYIDYRVNKISSKYYEKNFIQKEMAGQEEEMGIYSVNKNKNKNHKVEKIKNDEFDNVIAKNNIPKETNTVKNMIKNEKTIVPNTVPNEETIKKPVLSKSPVIQQTTKNSSVTQTPVVQKPLIENSVKETVMETTQEETATTNIKQVENTKSLKQNEVTNKKENINTQKNMTQKEKEKFDVLIKVYEKEYPFLIDINGDSSYINDFKTGQEYIITLSDNNVNVYEKTSNTTYKEIQMFTKKIYEYMQKNKTENNYMRILDSKEIEKTINITFVYQNGTLSFYNNKFKKIISLDEELELNNNGTNVKLKIDNSFVDFNSTENKIKNIVKN